MAGCNASSFGNRYRVPIEKRFRSAAAIVIGVDIAFLSKLKVRRLTERWQISIKTRTSKCYLCFHKAWVDSSTSPHAAIGPVSVKTSSKFD